MVNGPSATTKAPAPAPTSVNIMAPTNANHRMRVIGKIPILVTELSQMALSWASATTLKVDSITPA